MAENANEAPPEPTGGNSWLKTAWGKCKKFLDDHGATIQAVDSSFSVAKTLIVIAGLLVFSVLALFGWNLRESKQGNKPAAVTAPLPSNKKNQTQTEPQTIQQSQPGVQMNQTNPINSPQIYGDGTTINYNNQPPEKKAVVPKLPKIRLSTSDGLPILGDKITGEQSAHLKLHHLDVVNGEKVEIFNLCARVQLPEPILPLDVRSPIQKPVGSNIDWHQIKFSSKIIATGKGPEGRGPTVEKNGEWTRFTTAPEEGSTVGIHGTLPTNECFKPKEDRPGLSAQFTGANISGIWELQIDKVPSGKPFQIDFFTTNGPEAKAFLAFLNPPKDDFPTGFPNLREIPKDTIPFFIEGNFQYQNQQIVGTRHFFIPVFYDPKTRALSSGEPQEGPGKWRPFMLGFGEI